MSSSRMTEMTKKEGIGRMAEFPHFLRTHFLSLKNKGYPVEILHKYIPEVYFTGRERSVKNKENSTWKKILPFITQ